MWILYALSASVIWGLNYLLYEKILIKISVTTLYLIDFITASVVFLILSFLKNSLTKDFLTIQNNHSLQVLILGSVSTTILANLFIAFSIQSKNAPLAGLIEISYPIFIILLAWLLFKENHITVSVLIGGAFIFLGVGIIYYLN